MEGDIDAAAPLDYALFQIFPLQNRYEASVCSGYRVEHLAAGILEQLSLHLPIAKESCAKESIDNFNLNLPENLNGAAWFTKSTLTRFLHIVASPDLLSNANGIEDEISQLEEARKFQHSLYAKGYQDQFESEETDVCNLNDKSATTKPESKIASSEASRNELLRAMDLRLVALRNELDATFDRAAGSMCSVKEITDLAKFSEHFGAKNLWNSLCQLLELGQKSQIIDPLNNDNSSLALRSEIAKKIDGNSQTSKSVLSIKPVKYGVSPAKVAQVERQNSSESDEFSYSGDEGQTSEERSRAVARYAPARRSASPMRRVQIGRTGSRRAPALAIKSLNYFPTRERTVSHRDALASNSEEEGSNQPHKKPESNVQRMSVQDTINLFESKQRDQSADVQKQRASVDTTITANKAVLRRWSSGMGDPSCKCFPEIIAEGSDRGLPGNSADEDVVESSVEANAESCLPSRSCDHVETAEIEAKVEPSGDRQSSPIKTQSDTVLNQGDNISQRLTTSGEWSRLKEAELKSMMLQMKEVKPVMHRTMVPEGRGNQKLPSEQRGKSYIYKGKREKKLGENTGKQPEKEVPGRVMKQIGDQRKVETASKTSSNVEKEPIPSKAHKLHKNVSPSSNPRKETSKPAANKKAMPKDSSMPARRKSWPSAPAPRTTGTSPARNPPGVSSGSPKVTRPKVQPTQSLIQPVLKVERSRKQQKTAKDNQSHANRSLKGANEKKQQTVTKGSKTTRTKVLSNSADYSSMVPADSTFTSKMTKKSTVVPLESKPYLRKGSGIGPSIGTGTIKGKVSSQPKGSPKSLENLVQPQEPDVVLDNCVPVSQREEDDNLVSQEIPDADLESETQVSSHQNCDDEKSVDQVIVDGNDSTFRNAGNSPQEIQAVDESVISPRAWVEIEEHPAVPILYNDSTPQLASPANVAAGGISSPRVRQSLSQMLQEESSEPDIIEWGNAENPPTMVYHKDAPKGLKRLLKFARKSKGDANVTGWSSPSAFSEGEDDAEESKSSGRRHGDNLLRKSTLHAKNYGQQGTSLYKSYDGQSSTDKSKDVSASATTTKASRSFFSLSAFRGSKPNEPKLRYG